MESGSDVRKAWKCEDCEKIFKSETDRMPECEYCGNRYCIKCSKFEPGEYPGSGSASGAQAYVVTAAQNLNPKLTIQSSLTNSSTYSTSQTRYC